LPAGREYPRSLFRLGLAGPRNDDGDARQDNQQDQNAAAEPVPMESKYMCQYHNDFPFKPNTARSGEYCAISLVSLFLKTIELSFKYLCREISVLP
jgi:hypothetical protein